MRRPPLAAVQTARAKLAGRVDLAVRQSNDGVSLPPKTIRELVDTIETAIADYDVRAEWYPEIYAAQKSANLFAERVAKLTRELERVITRRTRRGDGFVSIGVSPETLFTIAAQRWIPALRRWSAAADVERNRCARSGHPKNRPTNEPRLRLECAVAAALEDAGVAPKTTKAGVFARVLEEAVYPAIGWTHVSAQTAVRSAIKALPEWRTLPRAGKL